MAIVDLRSAAITVVTIVAMARTPANKSAVTPKLPRSESSGQKTQKTLLGFFNKTPSSATTPATLPERPSPRKATSAGLNSKFLSRTPSQLTPAPSSDGPGADLGDDEQSPVRAKRTFQSHTLPSPVSAAAEESQAAGDAPELSARGTPRRMVSWIITRLM